jgi:hypothetical protein
MTNTNVKAVRYELEVCRDFVGGRYERISECFMPALGLVFNYAAADSLRTPTLNVLASQEPRNKLHNGARTPLADIEVRWEFVEKLRASEALVMQRQISVMAIEPEAKTYLGIV